jgi:uncharacterized membrane protein YhdT
LARMEAKVEVNQEEMRINQAKVDAHMEANWKFTYLLTYLLMELSPSGGATNSAATQEFPAFMEPEGSLPCSQEPSPTENTCKNCWPGWM